MSARANSSLYEVNLYLAQALNGSSVKRGNPEQERASREIDS